MNAEEQSTVALGKELLVAADNCDVVSLKRVLKKARANATDVVNFQPDFIPTNSFREHKQPSALARVCLADDIECAGILLQARADVNLVGRFPHQRLFTSTVCAAAELGNPEMMKLILKQQAIQSENLGEAAYTAASRGHVECLKLLLENSADVSAQGDGCFAVIGSVEGDSVECLNLLLDARADIEQWDHEHKLKLLGHAVIHRSIDCVAVLLERGAITENALCYPSHPVDRLSKEWQITCFTLMACGATGEDYEKVKAYFRPLTIKISECHGDLRQVIGEEVVVDTRIGLEDNGLYHEPLERVLEYCGFCLNPQRDTEHPVPEFLSARDQRPRCAMIWFRKLDAFFEKEQTKQEEDAMHN